jgi:lipopolysaccharide export system permease protein
LLTLAMPIAILISSIMTFGNLGESFELVAIKSSGISLLRFMRPLIWVSILLCGITFLFANYAIPYANLKFKTLYFDIYHKKPALDLKEGTFFTAISGYAIKVGKKDKDGKTIHNVVIYEQGNPLQDNCIIAEKGTMTTSADQKFLDFTLDNGIRYQERGNSNDTSTEFIRMQFKEYKKMFDLSALQMMNTSDSIFKNDFKMLSIRQLNRSIDSIRKIRDTVIRQENAIVDRFFNPVNIPDSIWQKIPQAAGKLKKISDVIPDSAKTIVKSNASSTLGNLKSTLQFSDAQTQTYNSELLDQDIEWHRKLSLSMACLVLFFIGAPLGSIIRKGGFGMPLVLAIIFFLIFHLLNMFGEKFAKEEVTSVFTGMWLSVIVLIPVGIFLTYKAMHDSQLFSKEFYHRSFKKFSRFIQPATNIFFNKK